MLTDAAACGAAYRLLRIGAASLACLLLCLFGGRFDATAQPHTRPILARSEIDFPPYAIRNAQGRADGYSVELPKAMAAAMGLTIDVRPAPWSEVVAAFRAGQLDLLPLVALSSPRDDWAAYSRVHTVAYDCFFVRRDAPSIESRKDADGKRLVPPNALPWRWILLALGGLSVPTVLISAWVISLRRQVKLRTAELARSHADLQRFAEVSAHHLQEPVRRLASYASSLNAQLNTPLSTPLSDTEIALSLSHIERQAHYLHRLLYDVQRYLTADQARSAVQSIAPRHLLTDLIERMAAPIDEASATIDLGELPPVLIDASRLEDVFSIVLENALQHAAPKSRRWRDGEAAETTAARTAPTSLKIHIEGQRSGNRVRYSIGDNGPGIDAEYRERVFRVFERLSSDSADSDIGTGIGLAILRRIAESCAGNAWIEAAPGGGCRVMIDLPAGNIKC